jgi:hypothetical protein
VALALAATLLAGCTASSADVPETAGGVIDSTLPIEEEIRRFVLTVDSVPTALREGAGSLQELSTRFLQAIEQRHTVELARLLLQRDEFIGVYYPQTAFTAPPYELSPGLVWFQMQNRSSRGISRLLQRDGGRALAGGPVHCATERREGESRIWDHCTVEATDSTGSRRDRRLFGGILEHGGTFKFLTYANEY